jgi:hypothetical protein
VNDAPNLLGNDRKDVVRGDAPGNERRDAPQRSLFLGEQAELVAARLNQPLRLAQIGLRVPAVGHVPGNPVHEALVGHGPRVPLEPAH